MGIGKKPKYGTNARTTESATKKTSSLTAKSFPTKATSKAPRRYPKEDTKDLGVPSEYNPGPPKTLKAKYGTNAREVERGSSTRGYSLVASKTAQGKERKNEDRYWRTTQNGYTTPEQHARQLLHEASLAEATDRKAAAKRAAARKKNK